MICFLKRKVINTTLIVVILNETHSQYVYIFTKMHIQVLLSHNKKT